MPFPDRFLLFSLLHVHEEQHLFLVDSEPAPQGLPLATFPNTIQGTNAMADSNALAGFHEQAILDANCQHVVLPSLVHPTRGNMNSPDFEPVYDMNTLLSLLQSCLHNERYDFWVGVAHEHQIKTLLMTIDSFCFNFICHVFSGVCVSGDEPGCKTVVNHEWWPQLMGIRVIDDTLLWVEQGALSVQDFVCVCQALGITLSAADKIRSLTKQVVGHQLELVDVLDAAALSLIDLVPITRSTFTAKMVKSISAAHGIGIAENDTKEDVTGMIFDHLAHGKCVAGVDSTPGCEHLKKIGCDSLAGSCAASHCQHHVQETAMWGVGFA